MKKFIHWLSTHRYQVEIPLFSLMMLTLILWRTGSLRIRFVVTIVFALLGLFYYISGRFKPDVQERLGIITTRVVSLSSMISVVGMLLTVFGSGLGREIAFLGAFCLIVTLIINLVFWIRSRNGNYAPFIIRAAVFALLAGAAFLQGI